MTKSVATDEANRLCRLMKTKGWQTRVWENMGWHYRLNLPIEGTTGGASIHPVGENGPYFCMISATHLGAGNPDQYDKTLCDDPNEAFENSLKVFQKLTNFLDQIKKTAYT